MKGIITLAIILLGLNGLYAQGIVDKYYSDLEALESTTSVFVSANMFDLISKFDIESDDEDFNDVKRVVNSITSFSLIKTSELPDAKSIYENSLQKIGATHEEMIRVKSEEERLTVYIEEDNDVIKEVAIVGYMDNDFLAASLLGEFVLEDITKVIEHAKSDDFEALTKLRKSGVTDMKVYPNPVVESGKITIEIPESVRGGKGAIYNANGTKMVSFDTNTENQTVDASLLTSGTYYVQLGKGTTSLKKQLVVIR